MTRDKKDRTPEELENEFQAVLAWARGSVEILNEALAVDTDEED